MSLQGEKGTSKESQQGERRSWSNKLEIGNKNRYAESNAAGWQHL